MEQSEQSEQSEIKIEMKFDKCPQCGCIRNSINEIWICSGGCDEE